MADYQELARKAIEAAQAEFNEADRILTGGGSVRAAVVHLAAATQIALGHLYSWNFEPRTEEEEDAIEDREAEP